MLQLTNRQRTVLIEHLPDAANVAVGGMFFGQFVADRPFSWVVALTGLVLWTTLVTLSLFLARRDR